MRIATLGTLLLATGVAACMTVGNKFDPALVQQLRPGISTEQDAVKLLGTPNASANYANGAQLLQWMYSQGTLVGGAGAHAAILFGPDGKMIRVTAMTRIGT